MADVDVLVQLEVAGEEAANRAAAALRGVGAAAGGGSGGGGGGGDSEGASGKLSRLQGAFERLERSEPSRFLRQSTFALESLALGAIGAEGPAAKLVATLGLFTAGTGIGLGLLTFTAAAAGAWHLFTAELRETNAQIETAQKNLTTLTALPKGATDRLAVSQGRGALQALGERTAFETTVSESSFLEKLSVLLPGGGLGFSTDPKRFGVTVGEQTGAVAEAARTRQASEETGLRLQISRAQLVIQAELQRAEQGRIQTLEQMALAVGRLQLGTHATTAELETLDTELDSVKLQTSGLTPAQRTYAASLLATARALERTNALEAEREKILSRFGFAVPQSETERAAALSLAGQLPGQGPAGARSSATTDVFTRLARGETQAGPLQRLTDQFGRPIDGPAQSIGILGAGGGTQGITIAGQAELDRQRAGAGEGLDTRRLAAILGQSIGTIGSVAQGGGVASVLTGAGGIAASLPGGQLPAALLGGLGGLVGLFSSGGAKISIARIEQEALRQLRDVLQIPTVSTVVVAPGGGDPRQTRYEQARLASKDGVTTLPYG